MVCTRRTILGSSLLGMAGLSSGAYASGKQGTTSYEAPSDTADFLRDYPLNIETSKLQRARSATVEVFREDPRRRGHANQRKGYGSGFLYARDDVLHKASFTRGTLVVTNQHVIDSAREVWVRRLDGLVVQAEIIVQNAETDLAILSVDYDDGPATLKLARTLPGFGDAVFAIGAPFGYTGTVTRGFITGMAVTYRDDDPVDYLQHDAIINNGSSGGPLLNSHGEVIGINTAIPDHGQTFFGIGLSTPAALIESALSNVVALQQKRPWFGVRFQQISPELEEALGWQDKAGLLIAAVDAHSPAKAAGLAVGDILTGADTIRFNTIRDFGKLMLTKNAGDRLQHVCYHRLKEGALDAQESRIEEVVLGEQKPVPAPAKEPLISTQKAVEATGITVSAVGDGTCIISTIAEDSVASLAGLSVGDTLMLFDMQPCRSTSQIDRIWENANKKHVPVLVGRDGQRPLFLALPRYQDTAASGLVGNSTLEISKAY